MIKVYFYDFLYDFFWIFAQEKNTKNSEIISPDAALFAQRTKNSFNAEQIQLTRIINIK